MRERPRKPEPLKYIIARIEQALAEDDRTNVQDIHVKIAAGKVFIFGSIESQRRREAVEEVVREVAPPGLIVVNELWIPQYEPPPGTETVP